MASRHSRDPKLGARDAAAADADAAAPGEASRSAKTGGGRGIANVDAAAFPEGGARKARRSADASIPVAATTASEEAAAWGGRATRAAAVSPEPRPPSGRATQARPRQRPAGRRVGAPPPAASLQSASAPERSEAPAAATATPPARRPRARGEAAREQKRAAILGAALEVFAERGYADTRLEDVARKAGVAKGTIYLYVPSKEALFEQLVRAGLGSRLALAEERVAGLDISAEEALRLLFTTLRTEVLETRRHAIARIVLAEAGRFPDLADFYYREVVTRGMAVIRGIAERGMATGEFASDALVRFPQLAIAPALVALVWTSLFQRKAPLDAEAMLETHLQILMRGLKGEPS
jgi:AcrR family transcriptional regulator